MTFFSVKGRGPLRIGFAVVAIGFLIAFSLGQWNTVRAIRFSFSFELLGLASLLACAALLVSVLIWHVTSNLLARRGSYLVLLRALLLSSLLKYIPGTVWPYVGIVYFLGEEGLAAGAVVASLVSWQALLVLGGLLMSMTLVPGMVAAHSWLLLVSVLGVLGVIVVVGRRPSWLQRRATSLLQTVRAPIAGQANFGIRDLLSALFFTLMMWCLYGLAFFAFCASLFPMDLSDLPTVTGAFALAYVSGYLAPFAPAGLGVREGLLTLLLVPVLAPGEAAVVALLSRLWLIGVEIVCLGVFVLPHRMWRTRRRLPLQHE